VKEHQVHKINEVLLYLRAEMLILAKF